MPGPPAVRAGGPTAHAPDERFATFTDDVLKELEVQTSPEPMARRMPGLEITSAHWKAYLPKEGDERLPAPDTHYPLHAVVDVSGHSSQALHEVSVPAPSPLPAIHPELYRYVPQQCSFAEVPQPEADQILLTDDAQIGEDDLGDFPALGYFSISELIVSSDCSLVIMVGLDFTT